jgi:trimethylamine--corrinoid protein Co-methyltransferase
MINPVLIPSKQMRFEPCSKDELDQIHLATLEVLETVGVKIRSEKVLDLVEDFGAEVDRKKQLVLLPSDLVEEHIRHFPQEVKLHTRDLKHTYDLSPWRVHFTNQCSAFVLDLDGKYREPQLQDTKDFVRLADSLGNVHIVNRPGAQDAPKSVVDAYEFEAITLNTTKPFFIDCYHGAESVRRYTKMASIILGDDYEKYHMFWVTGCCTSPLVWDEIAIGTTMEMSKHNYPVSFAGQPNLASNGPTTVAGSTVIANAEFISGAVISQFVRRGAPVMYMGFAYGLDMRTGQAATGNPEHNSITALCAQMSRFYRAPSVVIANTDAYVSDPQLGYEKGLACLISAMTGSNIVFAIGAMGPSLSFEGAVIDDEIVSMVRQFIEGIEVSDKTLAVDVIRKVGPGGHYLSQLHTRDYHEKELFLANLSNKKSYGAWKAENAKTVPEKARKKAKQLIETHEPVQLEKGIQKDLREYVQTLEKTV